MRHCNGHGDLYEGGAHCCEISLLPELGVDQGGIVSA